MSLFLTTEDVAILTGRGTKSRQVAELRRMGLPFWVNAAGIPVVPVAAIEGRKEAPQRPVWTPPR